MSMASRRPRAIVAMRRQMSAASGRMWVLSRTAWPEPKERMTSRVSWIWTRVEADGRLVEQQHVGPPQQRLREADALAVALGEFEYFAAEDVLQPACGDRAVEFGGEVRPGARA